MLKSLENIGSKEKDTLSLQKQLTRKITVRFNDLLPHQRLGALRPGPSAIHPFHITHQAVCGCRGPQATYGSIG